jgi:uncharacterized glyoxalase superfamily protein PhnB
MHFKALVPMLQTNDMSRTREWYETMLGFQCVAAQGNEWCRLARDEVAIMFMRNEHLGLAQATATQYFYVDDVMALWNTVKEQSSAEWGPEKMPYGMLEFAVKDPNGYLLSFGQQVV